MTPDCSTTWVTDFLVGLTPDLKEFEILTCSLNWTKLGIEMGNYDPHMAEFNEEVLVFIVFTFDAFFFVYLRISVIYIL